MCVEEVVDKGTFESRTIALHDIESASGDLHSSLEFDYVEILCDLPVLFGFECEFPLLSNFVNDHVVMFILSDGYGLMWYVGDVEDAIGPDDLEF